MNLTIFKLLFVLVPFSGVWAQVPVLQSNKVKTTSASPKETVTTSPVTSFKASADNLTSIENNSFNEAKVVLVGLTAPEGVNTNYLPLFGGYNRSEEQEKEDLAFMHDCLKSFSSLQEASIFFSKAAWSYLAEGSKDVATHRFNLAWLLNKENPEVYWGLGVLAFQKKNYEESIRLLENANSKMDDPALQIDLATVLIHSSKEKLEEKRVREALYLLEVALRNNPEHVLGYMQKTIAYLLLNQVEEAWNSFHSAFQISPNEVSTDILDELLQLSDDPKGIFKKP